MERKKLMFGLITGVFILTSLESPCFALTSKSNLATLQGLRGVGVLVEKLSPKLEKEGLTSNQLQIEVEVKLRASGVKVLTKDECLKTPGEPYLYINLNVNTAKTESDVFPYTIDAMLIQKVSLVRNPKQTTYAITWSTGGVGSISKELIPQLRSSVEDIVDIFIQAYLRENPKEKQENKK